MINIGKWSLTVMPAFMLILVIDLSSPTCNIYIYIYVYVYVYAHHEWHSIGQQQAILR